MESEYTRQRRQQAEAQRKADRYTWLALLFFGIAGVLQLMATIADAVRGN